MKILIVDTTLTFDKTLNFRSDRMFETKKTFILDDFSIFTLELPRFSRATTN